MLGLGRELALRNASDRDRLGVNPQFGERVKLGFELFVRAGRVGAVEHFEPGDRAQARLSDRWPYFRAANKRGLVQHHPSPDRSAGQRHA